MKTKVHLKVIIKSVNYLLKNKRFIKAVKPFDNHLQKTAQKVESFILGEKDKTIHVQHNFEYESYEGNKMIKEIIYCKVIYNRRNGSCKLLEMKLRRRKAKRV